MQIKSIKTKLLVLLLGIVIVSDCLLGAIAYHISKPALEDAVEETITTISDKIAQQVRQTNEREFHMLDALANTELLKDTNFSLREKNEVVHTAMSIDDNYENIAFYDAEGNGITGDGVFMNLANREYFQQAKAGKHYVSVPEISAVNGKLLMFYSVPVYSDSRQFIGAIVAVFHGQTLSDMCKEIYIGKESHPFIMDMKTGKTVADSDVSYVEKGQVLKDETSGQMQEAITTALTGATGYHAFFEPWRKKMMVAAYRPVGDVSGWTVFCMAPFSEYFGSVSVMVRAMVTSIVIVLIIAVVLSLFVISIIIKPLKSVEASITDIASGNADLTKRIAVTSNDEIGNVVKGFNKFTEKLQTIISAVKDSRNTLVSVGDSMSASVSDTAGSIGEILGNIESVHQQITGQSQSVQQTAGAVNEIASNIESLERMIATQSDGVSQASAAVEEMIGNIASVNQSVDKMANSFDLLQQTAQNGSAKQEDVNERIKQIESQSEMLQEANAAIAAIAEQTNLLAMNAAIEAAHAGEAGKGFSVVADEIRKLSETSTTQSKTIGDQLNSIKDSISSVVAASSESSAAFQNVSEKIGETDQLVRQIKAAMEEQTLGSQQISDALHAMNDSTTEVRTASHEMSIGNKQILDEVRHLQDATTVMLRSTDDMSASAQTINQTGEALNSTTIQMKDAIGEMNTQIDQFRV